MLISAAKIEAASPIGCRLAGFALDREAVRQSRPLEVNILRLIDSGGRSLFLFAFDLLFVGPVLKKRLREAFPDSLVLTFATHTHSAPGTDPGKPRLGRYEEAWTRRLGDQVVEAASRLTGADPATIRLSEGPIGLSVNRRRIWPGPTFTRRGMAIGAATMAPNLGGPRADQARLAVLRGSDGKVIAALASWACHPTSIIDHTVATSDYIGPLRAALRAELGEVPILFLQGCAGDVRSPGGRPPPHALLRRLLRGPRFYPFTAKALKAWESSVAAAMAALTGQGTEQALTGAIRSSSTSVPLSGFLQGAPERTFEIGRVQAGDALAFTYMEAEPCAAYARTVDEAFPGDWALGYGGDVFGYLPTDAQVRQGGYEVYGYMPLFGIEGRYHGSPAGVLKQALKTLGG